MMGWLTTAPVLALEGEWGDIRAILVVAVAVIVLIGSIYMLLWSNFGARVGYLVLAVSLGIWMILFSLIWLVGAPGTIPSLGPHGPEPRWIPFLAEFEQGQEFTAAIDRFPVDWDEPGETEYPGKIKSVGEFDTVKTAITEALARLDLQEGRKADDPKDWEFRLPGSEAPVGETDPPPQAEAFRFFLADDDSLLAGVTIPADDKHPEVTVFAVRDRGKVFLYGLYFLIGSILLFAFHLWLLVRSERKGPVFEGAEPTPG